jgi:hypothetical protein
MWYVKRQQHYRENKKGSEKLAGSIFKKSGADKIQQKLDMRLLKT